MGRVRTLQPNDIPQVIELNNRLFPSSAAIDVRDQTAVFRAVCFESPWRDDKITSLVYEDDRGALSGFLGVVMRPMAFQGRMLRAAVFQHLMVDRSTLASLQLFRALLEGPQDLSMGENAVDVVHRIWTRLGHPVSRLNSIYWRRFLRPGALAAHRLRLHPRTRLIATAALPFCRAADAALAHVPGNPLRVSADCADADEELDADTMLRLLPSMTASCRLTPVYTHEALSWLLTMLAAERRNGRLQKKLVRTSHGGIAGWYIYYLNVAGPSVVFQVAAHADTIGTVLEHLFSHACGHGAVELTGRLEPRFMKALAEKHCYFMPGRNWMLVHTTCPELLHAIDAGDAFLSRLEGDLWVL